MADQNANIGYEYGALVAVKTAARVGMTVPTGYKFQLNDEWLNGLEDDSRAKARSQAAAINEWLRANNSPAYGQHPDFARQMVQLARLAKRKQVEAPVAP